MRIAFEHVGYSYPGTGAPTQPQAAGQPHAQALQDVTFALEEGMVLGIAGKTGSGKSTLMRHMNGLLHPTSGRVTVDGADLALPQTQQELRGKVGLVFQYPEHQLFAATVEEDVAFGPVNLGASKEEAAARVRTALAQVGLDYEEVAQASPFALSGGQQRRVAIAGVLAMQPQVLVLDEPAAGLDPAAHASLLQLVARLHGQGMSVALVSHNMDDLAQLCTHMLVLNEGRVILKGTPAQVFTQEDALAAAGLEPPQAQQMANELRAEGVPLPEDAFFPTAESLADALAALAR